MNDLTLLGIIAAIESWVIIYLWTKVKDSEVDKKIIQELSNKNSQLKENIKDLQEELYDYHKRNRELEKKIEENLQEKFKKDYPGDNLGDDTFCSLPGF